MIAKKVVILAKNQKFVKDLKIGEVISINYHDYYFKGIQEIKHERGGLLKQVAFWSTKTDFKKYFNLELLEHIVTEKPAEDGYNW
jgi:hypothetical protein